MVNLNCWLGLVIWDSKGTPKQQSLSEGDPKAIQTTGPQNIN